MSVHFNSVPLLKSYFYELLNNFEVIFGNSKMSHLKISILEKQLKTFTGKRENLSEFLNTCESALKLCEPTDKELLFQLIKLKLSGRAYNLTQHRTFENWEQLKTHLIEVFSDKRSQGQWELELHSCRQNFNEDVMSYANRVETVLQKLIDSVIIGEENQIIKLAHENLLKTQAQNVFMLGLKGPIATVVKARNPKTFEEAISLAFSEERELLSKNEIFKYQRANESNVLKCSTCNKLGHITSQCTSYKNFTRLNKDKTNQVHFTQSSPHQSKFSRNVTCAYCKNVGHHISDCRKRKYNEEKKKHLNESQTSPSGSQKPQN